jgi:hypothetical protein
VAALVDGNPTSPDAYGQIQGDGGAVDKIAGTSGNDQLQGQAAFNQYYGGGGNDAFMINAKFAVQSGAHEGQSLDFGDQFAYITDFGGAGGWSASNNDFIKFVGFDSSTLTLEHVGASATPGAALYYYSVATTGGDVFNFVVNSLNGKQLGAGDFNFY